MTEYYVECSLQDICRELCVSEQVCIEIVDFGIVTPRGQGPSEWAFDINMIGLLRRAIRLQRDLELTWQDVAFVTELLDERDQLRAENRLLQQQLDRFLFHN